jgi:hypothetical protein
LGGFPKMIRCQILLFLESNGVLDNSYWSWNPNGSKLPPGFSKHELLNNSKFLDNDNGSVTIKKMHKILPNYYDSFLSIISETFFYNGLFDNMNPKNKPTFITEKTEKCFTAGQPFVVFATSGFLKKLKELGFKTFDKWWDESYDDEENETKRLNKIFNIILDIHTWPIEKCEKVFKEMIPILRYNQKLNYDMDLNHKKLLYSRDEYIIRISKKLPHLDDETHYKSLI